jgi:hypothetical protein
MTAKHTYTLLFRGEHVQTFTTVHEQQAVLLGYRRFPMKGQHRLDVIPLGRVADKPEVLRSMKTLRALKRDPVDRKFNTYDGQAFYIEVTPGTTEITDLEAEIVRAGR